jgi:hypothetical protein
MPKTRRRAPSQNGRNTAKIILGTASILRTIYDIIHLFFK